MTQEIMTAINEIKQQMMDCRWNLNALNNRCSLFESQIKQLQKEVKCDHFFTMKNNQGTCVNCGQEKEDL